MCQVEVKKDFFQSLSTPILGLLLIVGGGVFLAGAICDWKWLFQRGGSSGVWNLDWIDSFFGHTAARILIGFTGCALIALGLLVVFGVMKRVG